MFSLEELYLNKNNIKQMYSGIGNLQNLKVLDMSHNQITKIPRTIKNAPKLEKLMLADNQIEEAPAYLADIPNIKEINLNGNPLKKMSRKLCNRWVDKDSPVKIYVSHPISYQTLCGSSAVLAKKKTKTAKRR
jgi:Leucine-rich repeat (LRR) protein